MDGQMSDWDERDERQMNELGWVSEYEETGNGKMLGMVSEINNEMIGMGEWDAWVDGMGWTGGWDR